MRIHPERSRAIFDNPQKPASVTEYQFDGFDDEPEYDMAARVARASLANDDVIQLRIDDLLEGLSKPERLANWD